MQGWRLGFLGIETIPPWLGEFEVEQFFRLSPAEIATVKTRRGNDMQLGLGLHIGFLRMSGRALNSTDLIHWRILSFLGAQLQIAAPRVASLRALYPRQRTLYEHQQLRWPRPCSVSRRSPNRRGVSGWPIYDKRVVRPSMLRS